MHSSLQKQPPGGPTLTTITPTHEKTITIATQNVGGIKLESEKGRGPKLATLRNLVNKSTDFLVLTETRVDVCAVRKLKIQHGLKPTAFSLHRRPRGGVIIFSRLEHKLIPDSIRTSNAAGHITAAVYEVATANHSGRSIWTLGQQRQSLSSSDGGPTVDS
jgi:hypothetical protein